MNQNVEINSRDLLAYLHSEIELLRTVLGAVVAEDPKAPDYARELLAKTKLLDYYVAKADTLPALMEMLVRVSGPTEGA
jgi:hypothetical protein